MPGDLWTTILAALPAGVLGGALGSLVLELIRHRLALARDVAKDARQGARRAAEELSNVISLMNELTSQLHSATAADIDRLQATAAPRVLIDHLAKVRVIAKRFVEARTTFEETRRGAPTMRETRNEQMKVRSRGISMDDAIQRRHEMQRDILRFHEDRMVEERELLEHWLKSTTHVLQQVTAGALGEADLQRALESAVAPLPPAATAVVR